MLGSAPGDSTGTQQDPTSRAEAALLILVNLSQFILGCMAIPPHQTFPYPPNLTFQGGPGGGRTAPRSHGLLPAAASSHPRSCNSANKGVSAPSVLARRETCAGHHPTDSPLHLQVQGEIYLCQHQQQREERLCRGMERQCHQQVPGSHRLTGARQRTE